MIEKGILNAEIISFVLCREVLDCKVNLESLSGFQSLLGSSSSYRDVPRCFLLLFVRLFPLPLTLYCFSQGVNVKLFDQKLLSPCFLEPPLDGSAAIMRLSCNDLWFPRC